MIRVHLLTAATLLFITGSSFAQQDIQLIGPIVQPLARQSTHALKKFNAPSVPTSVTLLNIKLSDNAWEKLQVRAQEIKEQPLSTLTLRHGKRVQLGMGQVPVFDQGPHGTCTTFATVAAIDAALNQGDTISELCQLQLGRYFEHNGYNPSGWDGAMGPMILNQMQTFGVVTQINQREKGCGGLTEYPMDSSATPETEMSLAEFHAISKALPDEKLAWSAVLDVYQVFVDKTDPNITLEATKSALDAGDRLTFGVLLFGLNQGLAGAVGTHHVNNDSWVLSAEIIKDLEERGEPGAHEMIITGYDDDAVALDKEGESHRGLLTLRNSWGTRIGDQGNFYMSYDYFKTLAIEVQRIRSTS